MHSLHDIRQRINDVKSKLANASETERKSLAEAGNELVSIYLKACGWIVLPWVTPVKYTADHNENTEYKPIDEVIELKKFKVSVSKDCANCGHRMKPRKYRTKKSGLITRYVCHRCKNGRHKRKYKIFVE